MKVLSILLILVFELSSFPVSVFAQQASSSSVPQVSGEGASESATLEFIQNITDLPAIESEQEDLRPDLSTPSLPEAELRLPPRIKKLLKKTFTATEKVAITVQNTDILEIEEKLTYSDGSLVEADTQEIKNGEDTEIRISPSQSFKPGKYKLTVHANGQELKEEFFWGVLAINTNKSIYLSKETANLGIAVLDEHGDMVCDAKLELRIRNKAIPDSQGEALQTGSEEILSTEDGKIKTNPTCTQKALILEPDYSASYTVGEAGVYDMTLSAVTANGSYSIDDSFEVRESVDFDIERITATRIYPPETYPVTFKMKANRDFQGTVSEVVPDNFGIYQQEGVLQYRQVRASDSEALEKEEVLGDKTIGYPFEGEAPITLGFGEPLRDPSLKKIYYDFGIAGHDGMDFGLEEGTPVIAVDDGKVVLADTGGPYGSTIVIEHSWGKSYYGHLSEFLVEKDQEITRGEKIALSGSTGLSLGPHLHFGIKLNKNYFENGYYGKTNPAPFLGISTQSDVLGTSTYKSTLQIITWDLSVKKGEDITFGYKFKAPEISPQLYKIGPLRFAEAGKSKIIFEETRQWKLAIDAPNNKFVKQGSFAKISGTGSQSVTGVGFKPKAVIFYWTNQTADGTTAATNGVALSFGIGFATGSNNEAAVSYWDEGQNAAAVTDAGRATYNNASIVIQGDSGALTLGIADFTSFDPDGFTINWSTSDTNLYVIHYQAFSETIISNATVSSFSFNQGGGNLSITDAGFQPDFVMFASGGTATNSANYDQGTFTVGAATGSNSEWTIGVKSEDNTDSSDTCSTQQTNASIYMISNKPGVLTTQDCTTITGNRAIADFTEFTSNGFDINKSTTPAEAFNVFYLALKGNGTSFITGSFNKPSGTGSSAVTGTGFLPTSVFLASWMKASSGSVTASGTISIGGTSGVAQEGAFGLAGETNIDAYDSSVRMLRTKSIVEMETDADTVTGEASLTSFDTNGFTLNWTTNTGDALDEILYWSIGEILDNVDLMRHGKWFHQGAEQPFAF